MKLRIMGLPAENEKLISALKRAIEIDIISISAPRANRGYSKEERIYIECKVDVNYTPADVVNVGDCITELKFVSGEGITSLEYISGEGVK